MVWVLARVGLLVIGVIAVIRTVQRRAGCIASASADIGIKQIRLEIKVQAGTASGNSAE